MSNLPPITSLPTEATRSPRGWIGAAGAIVPLVICMGEPLRWLLPLCVTAGNPAGWQLLVPLGAAVIAWRLRHDIAATETDLSRLFPDPGSPQRSGSAGPLAAGCLLLLLAHVSMSPPLAAFGAIGAAMGWAWQVRGPFVVRKLAPAFGYLLLAVPIPHRVVGTAGALGAMANAKLAGQLLPSLGVPCTGRGTFLYLGGSGNPFPVGLELSGLFGVSATLAAGILWAVIARVDLRSMIRVVMIGLGVGLLVNFALICLLASMAAQNAATAWMSLRTDIVGAVLSVVISALFWRRHCKPPAPLEEAQ